MLTKILVLAGVLYLTIALAMFFGQRRLIYVPDAGGRISPERASLPEVVERVIAADDGAEVISWYGKARPGQPTLLYFHGNAGSLASRADRIRTYLSRGRGVMMMSYRGYSGSAGTPSESANVADAVRAFDNLVAGGVHPKDIIIYGESLGSGVAVQVAVQRQAAGLILDAPYTSLADVAADQYPWLPVRPMMLDRYDSAARIAQVGCPLLIVHGEFDSVIPLAMGKALFARSPAPKEMKVIAEAGHADHDLYGSYDVINAWIGRLRGSAS